MIKLAITRQGNFAHVGWFKNLHPVFTNHDELLEEFKEEYGHITDEVDITAKTEKRRFASVDEEGNEKEESLMIRVISIFVPSDIAEKFTERLLQEWDENERKKMKKHTRNRKMGQITFVPYAKRYLDEESQINQLLEHGKWLAEHKDVIFIRGCENLEIDFKCLEALADITNQIEGKNTTITKILKEWVTMNPDTDKEEEHFVIEAIERMEHNRYVVLMRQENLQKVKLGLEQILLAINTSFERDERIRILGRVGGYTITSTVKQKTQTPISQYLKQLQHDDQAGIQIKTRNRYQATRWNPRNEYANAARQPGRGGRVRRTEIATIDLLQDPPKEITMDKNSEITSTTYSENTTVSTLVKKQAGPKQMQEIESWRKQKRSSNQCKKK